MHLWLTILIVWLALSGAVSLIFGAMAAGADRSRADSVAGGSPRPTVRVGVLDTVTKSQATPPTRQTPVRAHVVPTHERIEAGATCAAPEAELTLAAFRRVSDKLLAEIVPKCATTNLGSSTATTPVGDGAEAPVPAGVFDQPGVPVREQVEVPV